MIRYALTVLAVGALMGCQVGAGVGPRTAAEEQRAEAAAHAATIQYPQDVDAQDLQMTAVVDQQANTVKILNPTGNAIRNVDIWINGTYVRQVRSIPPNGSVTLNRAEFYDQAGRSMGDVASAVTRVQLQSADQLYNLQGPVFE